MTDRLVLRRFEPADLEDLAALHADPAVMRFIDDGRPVAREVVAGQTLPGILAGYQRLPAGLGRFALQERRSGGFVGWASLVPANSVGLEEHPGLELGYRIRPSMWGRGYAAEGARALILRAFEYAGDGPDIHGCESVAATTMTVNTASRRVMEKVGLRYVRTFFADWPDAVEGSEHGDVVYERSLSELRRE
ncbi:GNAT family N-acetyltransferase [Actinospica robiniae]|uniref:GNAT family N-acetyltransferase n=1 Tax=Actinospica robiniae TaxID=304901 RepID=UPI000409378D|nr:GNAT family N-acetyltransferase [Actinospica robiniae]